MNVMRMGAVVAALVMAVGPALAGCSSSQTTETITGSAGTGAATVSPAAAITLTDGWVKAAPSGMTALFGTLHNTTDGDITVVGGVSDVAGKVELHEVVMAAGEAKLQPKEGGFRIPAGGTLELAPGHDHVMLMALKRAVEPGDDVEVALSTAAGVTVTVSGIAKEYAGGNESYGASPAGGSAGDMSMAPSASASGS